MDNQSKWIYNLRRKGRASTAAGIALFVVGVILPRWTGGENFNTRIVSGLGILLVGIGISFLVRWRTLSKGTLDAERIINLERDERILLLRAKAGNRGFWAAMAIAYAGLMWVSFASNGSLPRLTDEALWWYLSGLVVVPFVVYVVSLLVAQKNE